MTPKVRIVERHVSKFLKLKGETTRLGFWSEQSMEAGQVESQGFTKSQRLG